MGEPQDQRQQEAEFTVQSSVQVNQNFDAQTYLKQKIETCGWRCEQHIRAKQAELAKADGENSKLAGKLKEEVNRAVREHFKPDVAAFKELLVKLGVEKKPVESISAWLDEDGQTINYNLSFSALNCAGCGSIPATAEAQELQRTIKANRIAIEGLQDEIKDLLTAKDDGMLAAKIAANEAAEAMMRRCASGRALISDVERLTKMALPASEK